MINKLIGGRLVYEMSMFPYILDSISIFHLNRDDRANGGLTAGRPKVKITGTQNCIFCLRSSPEVCFNKKAHILPNGLGNNTYFNIERECDECNQLFSKFENDLVSLLSLARAFGTGHSKNGDPEYRDSISKAKIKTECSGYIKMTYPDNSVVCIDNNLKDGLFYLSIPALSYLNVFRSVLHSAWSFLSEETRTQFEHVRKWMTGEDPSNALYMDLIFIPGQLIKTVKFEIWRSNKVATSNYPIVIRLYYGYYILQVWIPKTPNIASEPIVPEDFIYGLDIDSDVILDFNRIPIENSNKTATSSKVIYFQFDSYSSSDLRINGCRISEILYQIPDGIKMDFILKDVRKDLNC